LSENSPSIDFGFALTQTVSSGSGNTIPVEYAGYFYDGFGLSDENLILGDSIQIGERSVQILEISSGQNTITVSENIEWEEGDAVSFLFSGSAPDLGWKEYGESTVGLQGDVNCDNVVDAVDALFILQYTVDLRPIDALFLLQCAVSIPNVLCP